MSDHPPQDSNQPARDREVVVTNGGSGNGLGTGIIVGLLVVIVALALIWFFASGSDDGGIDVPDTLELDVDVDDGTDGADDGGGEDGGEEG